MCPSRAIEANPQALPVPMQPEPASSRRLRRGHGRATLDEDCFEMSGQMFCTYIDRKFNIGFTAVPATGTATISCWGECGFEATAPVEAIKQP